MSNPQDGREREYGVVGSVETCTCTGLTLQGRRAAIDSEAYLYMYLFSEKELLRPLRHSRLQTHLSHLSRPVNTLSLLLPSSNIYCLADHGQRQKGSNQ